METHPQKTPMRDMALRAVAVLGLIAVLLLGAWGIIQLAVAIPNLFSNFGGGVSNTSQKETLVVSQAANITSGQSLQVSWTHANKNGSYSYSLSFACQNGLSVKAPLPTGSYQVVECNKPFNYVNATERMVVIPTATTATLPLTFTVSATKLSSGAAVAQGSATTNVAPAAATKTPTKATTSTTAKNTSSSYYAAPAHQALYGYGDLAVTVGSIAPAQSGLNAVTFTIANTGTNSIGAGWVFSAALPINGSYTFMSQPQRALLPGDKMVYTLTYSNPNGYNYNGYNTGYGYTGAGYYSGPSYYTGAGSYTCNGYTVCSRPSADPIDYAYGSNYNYNTYNYGYNTGYNYGYSSGPVTITVDPQNAVWESNEYNNTATVY